MPPAPPGTAPTAAADPAAARRRLPGWGAQAHRWLSAVQMGLVWSMPVTDALERARIAACLAHGRAGVAPAALPALDAATFASGLRREVFRRAIRRVLGIPIAQASVLLRCGCCHRDLAPFNLTARTVHLETCAGGAPDQRGAGGRHAPHNRLRGALRGCVREAGFYTELEPQHLLGPDCEERPADVAAFTTAGVGEHAEDGGRLAFSDAMEKLAIDVTIPCVRTAGVVNSPAGARAQEAKLAAAEQSKRRKYGDRCAAHGVTFTPFAANEFGVMGPAARDLIGRLAKAAANRETASYVDGPTVQARTTTLRRRWTEAIARAVTEATDILAQKRLARSCGIAGMLNHDDTIEHY